MKEKWIRKMKYGQRKLEESERKRDKEKKEKGGRHNPFGATHRRKRIRRRGDKRQVLTENMNICLPRVL